MRATLLHVVVFGSGAVALVYEVLWMRRLTLLLGATAPATATTLAAFFLGLGLGSFLFGTTSARFRRPLLAFGLIEITIGAVALLVEPILRGVELLISRMPDALAEQPSAALATKMVCASLAVLPPALLMGGSLPVLSQAVDARSRQLGVKAGGLYAANTLGAALGCLAFPLALLPSLGATGSLWAAATCSFVLGAVAVATDFASPRVLSAEPQIFGGLHHRAARSLLGASFLSGVVALGLEVLWTRMLALVHENSVHSFAAVIAIYLLGIGGGAAAARWLLLRGWAPLNLLGAAWIGAGFWTSLTPRLFFRASAQLDYLRGSSGLFSHELKIGGLAFVTLFPAALLSGVALPVLLQLFGRGRTAAGPAVGRLLAVNTLGAVAGPLLALFVVGPAVGLWWGITLAGLVLLVAGEIALSRQARRSMLAWRLSFYALLAAFVVLLDPGSLPRVRLEAGERLIALREGAFGTVAVVEHEGERRLALNNHYVIGGTASTGEERLQAHIPLLLHPDARAVAFLGLGTGITASAALFHPVREVVVLELVPEVLDAARHEFRGANLSLLEDPRVHAATEDARAYLRRTRERFDVIVGDLVVPWRPGEASLYTLESFQAARRALAPGGIYCQWVPLFQLSKDQFEAIAATFLDVFPRVLLWRGDFRAGEPAVALIGLTSEEPIDPITIDARSLSYARTPDPSNPFLADPAGLWTFLVGPLSPLDDAWQTARRNKDSAPTVELESPGVDVTRGTAADSAFTHERLKPFFDYVLALPLGGTALERLEDRHLRWREAGAEIWEASLLALQGRTNEADQLGLGALSRLPAGIQEAARGAPPP